MAGKWAIAGAGADVPHFTIRKIGVADLREVLARGYDDFLAMPSQMGFLGMIYLIYPLVAYLIYRVTFGYDLLPMFFPLLGGFAFFGPFAAFGLYELSRRRELGLEFDWKYAIRAMRSPAIPAIGALALALAALFLIWLDAAWMIYKLCFGNLTPASVGEFLSLVFTTKAGWAMILIGNGVGALFAAMVLTLSVVSFPLLLDCNNVGLLTAVQTSVRAVMENPKTMMLWGVIVVGALMLGCLPFFFGLAIIMPILGHATWHLYRKVVAR